jgi:hypothetical protein
MWTLHLARIALVTVLLITLFPSRSLAGLDLENGALQHSAFALCVMLFVLLYASRMRSFHRPDCHILAWEVARAVFDLVLIAGAAEIGQPFFHRDGQFLHFLLNAGTTVTTGAVSILLVLGLVLGLATRSGGRSAKGRFGE